MEVEANIVNPLYQYPFLDHLLPLSCHCLSTYIYMEEMLPDFFSASLPDSHVVGKLYRFYFLDCTVQKTNNTPTKFHVKGMQTIIFAGYNVSWLKLASPFIEFIIPLRFSHGFSFEGVAVSSLSTGKYFVVYVYGS